MTNLLGDDQPRSQEMICNPNRLRSVLIYMIDCTYYVFQSLVNMAPLSLDTIFSSVTFGNVFLLLLVLLMLHYLMVLYEFRDMPPGPRLTTLPVLGNVFSLDLKAEKLGDAFQRSVKLSRIV